MADTHRTAQPSVCGAEAHKQGEIIRTLRKSPHLDFLNPRLILKAMEQNKQKPLKIFLRLPNGWSERVENTDQKNCDIDGQLLWIDPGGQIYCDAVHTVTDLTERR